MPSCRPGSTVRTAPPACAAASPPDRPAETKWPRATRQLRQKIVHRGSLSAAFPVIYREPEFVLEGDSLAAMQNARALHRAMNVMRTLGQ